MLALLLAQRTHEAFLTQCSPNLFGHQEIPAFAFPFSRYDKIATGCERTDQHRVGQGKAEIP